jgi:phytoene/squalene synthetase
MSSDNRKTMSGIDHYENFPVASWLCPAHLRPAVVAIYQFARTADDIADEGDADADTRLRSLSAYSHDLLACFEDPQHISPQWPEVFTPLAKQIQAHALPWQPLQDLLDAFVQDVRYTQAQHRYASRDELLDYCRRSANPVGRLVLHLYGVVDAVSLSQSDAICSALQLINFWQDLSVDLQRGRYYLPEGANLAEEIAFARHLMQQGSALVHAVPGRGGWELRLVVQGGLRILDKLEGTDPAQHRPTLGFADVVLMLWRSVWMRKTV